MFHFPITYKPSFIRKGTTPNPVLTERYHQYLHDFKNSEQGRWTLSKVRNSMSYYGRKRRFYRRTYRRPSIKAPSRYTKRNRYSTRAYRKKRTIRRYRNAINILKNPPESNRLAPLNRSRLMLGLPPYGADYYEQNQPANNAQIQLTGGDGWSMKHILSWEIRENVDKQQIAILPYKLRIRIYQAKDTLVLYRFIMVKVVDKRLTNPDNIIPSDIFRDYGSTSEVLYSDYKKNNSGQEGEDRAFDFIILKDIRFQRSTYGDNLTLFDQKFMVPLQNIAFSLDPFGHATNYVAIFGMTDVSIPGENYKYGFRYKAYFTDYHSHL